MRGSSLRPIVQASLALAAVLALAILWTLQRRVGLLWANTAALAAGALAIAVPLGTIAAVILSKTDAPGRRLAGLLLMATLFVPLFLFAGAWDAGFGIQGWHTLSVNPHLDREPWLAGWRAAIWIHGLAAVPWVALIVSAGLCAVEAELEEDATLCVAPWQVLWHVTLRRAAAAMLVAALWVAIVAAAEISVTDFFQVRTFAEEVYTQAALGAFELDEGQLVAAGGLWLGLVLAAVLAVFGLVVAHQRVTEVTDAPSRRQWRWRLGRWRWPAAAVLWTILILVAGLPLGNLVYKAGIQVTMSETGRIRHWSAAAFWERASAAPGEHADDLWLTIAVGSAAASAAVLLGLPLAWSLRLARRVPLLRLGGLAVCLTLPGPLLGLNVIRILNRPPDSPLAFLAPLYDTYFSPWFVQTMRALPLVTLILWAALASVSRPVLDAAALDGAGWWGRLLRIALPQRWPAVFAAWLVGLAVACGELAATVLVMPPGRATAITVRIFQLLHYGVDDRVAAVSLVMALGYASVTAVAWFMLTPQIRRAFGE
jgi:iron(III) transport system permease protein